MPEMMYVDSTNVEQIGYDEDNMELHVVFKSGSQYVYSGVPSQIFDEIQVAPSVGSFLNREVKGTYPYETR